MFQKSNAFSSPRGTKHSSTMTRQNILNEGQENEMELFGYKKKQTRNVLCIIGYIFTLGILKIIFYWKPQLDVWSHCVSCSLADADVILLRTTDEFKKYTKKKVKSIHSDSSHASPNAKTAKMETSELHELLIRPQTWVRYIRVQRTRYMWNPSESMFQKIGVLEENLSCSDIHAKYGLGLSSEEQTARQKLCGPNTIDVEITPILKLLFKEVLNPIYGFSVYSISIWLANGYFEFSIIILLLSIISLFSTTYLLRKHSVKLHNMVASHNNIVVSVLQRNGVVKEVESKYLVPGDVLIISEKKFYLPCDALLISGGCITNECMLTGESVPVTKVPLPNVDNGIPWNLHSGENNRAHMLYCGTEVIKTILPVEGSVKALVLKTGFNTAKGDLIRSILYPKPVNFKLHREVWKVISGLMVLSVAGIIYTIVINSQNGATAKDMVIMSLLMITLAIPVSLPPTLTTCSLYSQTRLKKQGIFCISPQRIIVCGQLNLLCFDKTGTLTEDCLDLWGIVPSGENRFLEAVPITPGCTLPWSPLIGAMASCHSLVLIDGKVHGDPLDMKMFEGTGWELEECKVHGESSSYSVVTPRSQTLNVPVKGFCIFYQFPFSSSLQRMTVITKTIGESKFWVFMKGAPEVIIQFCRKETVPDNFSCILDHYTMQGYRAIGMAYKDFKSNDDNNMNSLKREEVENELHFLGFLIMENRIKSETKPVLHELKSANIRTIMVTGDNLKTACTVGLSSGMVSDASRLLMLEACEPYGERPASFTSQSVENHRDKLHTQNESMKCIVSTASDSTCRLNATAGKYQYAVSGKSYEIIKKYFPDMIPDILLNGTIFGRMTPQQKTGIIKDLQNTGYYVGMCGDGANDCGALKAAHAGISLSNLEASMASPFTSNIPNIQCVPKLLKEGRNTFVAAICLFKFLIMFTLIQFVCMILLFWKNTLLGNYHYLMQDIAISVTVILTMSLTGPASKLAPYRPAISLLSPPLLLSMVLQISFTVIIQTSAFFRLQQQQWYNESNVFSACLPNNETSVNQTMMMPRSEAQNFITTTLWPVSGINLIILECVFSKGRPFRKPMYTNYIFCILVFAQLVAYLFILFADIESVYYAMELVCTPYYWRLELLGMLIILFAASYSVEVFVYNRKLWLVIKKIFDYKSKSQYKKILWALEKHTDSSLHNGLFPSEQQFSVQERDCV